VELLALRGLVVQFVRQPGVLTSIMDGVLAPVAVGTAREAQPSTAIPSRSRLSSEEQDQLVELSIARNATG
jgi:hypothetical protein